MKMRRVVSVLLAIAGFAILPSLAKAQLSNDSRDPSGPAVTTPAPPALNYTPPTQSMKLRNYAFDAFGPYPVVVAAFTAGINQAYNTPPEWKQGAAGFGKRFGSDFGIALVSTTTHYALAQAFKEDTLYYRCGCKGVFPRLKYSLISTLTSRRGLDGHRAFSFSALIAPYAGTMTAVYAWFPGRFDARDAFRMGNYNLLAYAGSNLALEFLYRGPHSLVSRLHLDNRHGALAPGPNP